MEVSVSGPWIGYKYDSFVVVVFQLLQMLLLVNLSLIFLASSVLGRPSGFGPTIKRDVEDNVDVDDSWKALYDGHQRYLAEMELNHPTLMEDLATNGQRKPSSFLTAPIPHILSLRSQLRGDCVF